MRGPPVMRRLGRALAVIGLFATVGMGSAAIVTYLALNDTTWTTPADPAPTPAPGRPAAATPEPTPTTHGPETPWSLGDCYTSALIPIDCDQPGALTTTGIVQRPHGPAPCAGLPVKTTAVAADGYTLCLTA
ncbi:hypothetical protein [Streptomyces sp. IB2014 016-6]|uniref:hypothetical protein n=1 Tax=Streptomyces sp. IB2014 016-6 TaxID=2517818 RepID=UPI0011C9506E|nr:hypothetical protein [Streptomyces sp. IB2014 016-6]TXL91605.1 hypothetical protein EW053_04570 [Streptomyces sp. IB2014 016-6]